MKNMTIQIRWMMGMLVLLLAGCDKESDDMVLPVGRREIVVSGVGTGFVQKRDAWKMTPQASNDWKMKIK